VFDDSLEIYVCPTPDAADRVDYQFLVNSLDKCSYNIHKLGDPKEEVSWRGDWQHASSLTDGWWQFEVRIPIESMKTVAPGRKDHGRHLGTQFRSQLEAGLGWSSLSGGYANSGLRFTFTKEATPRVRFRMVRRPLAAADGRGAPPSSTPRTSRWM